MDMAGNFDNSYIVWQLGGDRSMFGVGPFKLIKYKVQTVPFDEGDMKIGLIRHFEVLTPYRKSFMNSEEFALWAKEYEESELKPADNIPALVHWPRCFCSSSSRTVRTADLLYRNEFEKTDLIREVPIAPIFQTDLKLPFVFWLISGRIAWLISHRSQPESISRTLQRVKSFVSEFLLSNDEDVLVISHGFIMGLIRKELLAKGFKGKSFIKAKHGTLYVYQK